jgi:hypothetical protein
MINKTHETVIIGAGIAGLACAKSLAEKGRKVLILTDDIGGRILTSFDGKTNYGAFFVCADYHYVLKHSEIKSRIKLRDFCFHEKNQTYVLFEPKMVKYSAQFMRIVKLLLQFKKSLHKFRKISELMSQKRALEKELFLHNLYMQKAESFVRKHKIGDVTDSYLSKGLYATTFSKLSEMNAFSFLEFLLPLITPIYTFNFNKDEMIRPFKERIVMSHVENVTYKQGQYEIATKEGTYKAKNVVLATQIGDAKRITNINKTNKSVSTNMLHVRGEPQDTISKKVYHLFSPQSNVQAIANLRDGTFLVYYKHEYPQLEEFFYKPCVIAHKVWDPAGTINGHTLIESNRGDNFYLIGDFNVCGLEDSYITGIYAANKISERPISR